MVATGHITAVAKVNPSYFTRMNISRIVGAGTRNDTSHRGYWNTVDIRFM